MGLNDTSLTIMKNKYLHFYKNVRYNNRSRYKKIEYFYDLLDTNNGDIKETKRHNTLNKPAVITYSGSKIIGLEYWYKGERHREYAPAIISLSGKEIIGESWYEYGKELTEDEIDKVKKVAERRKKVLKIMLKGILKRKNKK